MIMPPPCHRRIASENRGTGNRSSRQRTGCHRDKPRRMPHKLLSMPRGRLPLRGGGLSWQTI